MNRREIAKNYLKFWFWFDFVASFPYAWIVDGVFEEKSDDQDSSSTDQGLYSAPQLLRLIKIFKFLRILKLLRLAKFKRILMTIEDYVASNTIATFIVFFRLLSIVFFIAHWTACWWYYVSVQDMLTEPITWVSYANMDNAPVHERYITALYWSFTTMTTVGYGDIVPFTINEKIYAMFSMIVACGVFAYTVGSIGSLVSKRNAVENAYREQVVAVNRYMRKKELPQDLQFRVRRYLEYVWDNKKKNNLDEKEILSLLSEPLRDEIYAHIHGVVIKVCTIFNEYEPHFLSQLSKALETETYGPGDTVIEEGEMSSKIYFIQNGKVDIYHQATKSSFRELKSDDYFGEISFFTDKPRCASAKCSDYVDLLALSKNNMNLLLEKFPEAKEVTENVAKKCENGDLSCLHVYCYICKELGHVAIRCRKILLNLDQEESRNRWLEYRNKPHTKYINPTEPPHPSYHRTPRHFNPQKFTSRNIKGVRKETERLFPRDPRLYPKIRGYIQRYMRVTTPSSSSTSLTVGDANLHPLNNSVNSVNISPAVSSVKKDPLYTIIYMDSESSDHDIQELKQTQRNYSISFDKSPEISPPSLRDPISFSKAVKTSKIVPVSEIHSLEVPNKEELTARQIEKRLNTEDIRYLGNEIDPEVSKLFSNKFQSVL
jgi:hypothetical protein